MEHSGAVPALGPLPPRRFREGNGPKRSRGVGRIGYGLVLLAVFAAARWTVQVLLPPLKESAIVVEGLVEMLVDIEAFVVREEHVTYAPFTGTVKRLVSDGERVRVGSDVIELDWDGNGTPMVIKAPLSGLVHFETDGLEGHLTPNLVDAWSAQWFRSLPPAMPQRIAEGRIEVGQPLFKIVDSFNRGLTALVDPRMLLSIEPGRQVGLRIGARDGGLYPGRLTHIQRNPDHVMVYIAADHLPEAMSITRRARISLLLNSISGKVVPRTAIDVRRGSQGVWTMEADQISFLPVKVLGGDAVQVVIEAEIPLGTRIRRVAPTYSD